MGKKKKNEPPPHLDIPEAPVFHPTAEEWRDPLRYIAEVVRPVVEHTSGICRIAPPAEWVKGLGEAFAIDRTTLKFSARVQRVDQLQRKHTAVASQRFWNEYQAWMAANGIKRKGGKLNPVFGGKEVELDRLHAIVQRRGGYAAVTEERGWREVANVLDLDDKSGNAAFSLRKLYEKLLRPFDDYCQERAEGGYGLLAAAMSAEADTQAATEAGLAAAAGMDDNEGAEILLAMLGLAPEGAQKQLKPGARTLASPAMPRSPPTACEKCKGGHAADRLVQCDRCAKGWHLFCLSPPLSAPPAKDWVCPECRSKEFEAFAFQDTDDYTLEEFEGIAATFEEQWFGADALPKLTYKDKEAEFWRIVEDGEDVVEVLYGADLDSSDVGSGFPRGPPLGDSDSAYASDPWNLSVLPRQAGRHSSLLRVLDGHIAGVTVPWVYVGMCFSSFCWHVEDHMFYSINYNHWGAPKQWYGVPAWAAAKFEAVFQKELADQVAAQPDLLFQLLSMVSPRALRQHGVPVYSATQAAGEFVVTFPNAYHGGFCMGVNLGEAVNFAPGDWLRFGAAALGRLRYFRKPCVVSQEEMLLRVAAQQGARAAAAARALPAPAVQQAGEHQAQQNGDVEMPDANAEPVGSSDSPSGTNSLEEEGPSPLLCYYLRQELRRVVDEEWVLRGKLWSQGLRRSRRTPLAVGFEEGDTDDAECAICHLYMHLSAVECDCCKGRRVCLHHAANLCGCHMSQRRLVYRHSLRQLEAVHAEVASRVPSEVNAELDGVEAASSARTADAAAAAAAAAAKAEQEHAAAKERAAAEKKAAKEQQKEQKDGEQEVEQQQQPAVKEEPEQDEPAGTADAEQEDAGAVTPAFPASQPEDAAQESKAAVQGAPAGAGDAAPAASAEPRQQQQQQPPTVQANVPQQDGPVRPFVSVDVCPWDLAELPEWREALHTACQQWREDAAEALAQGGYKADQLEDLAEESEQYLWGDAPDEVVELAGRVQRAAAYIARVRAALKGQLTLQEVEALLGEDPKPVPDVAGLPKLKEGVEQARSWLERSQEFLSEARSVEWKALERFVAEANSIPVLLPEAKSLRERSAAARKLADALRSALPNVRGEGRRRGAEQLSMEGLRQLQQQAAALRVEMPEQSSLALALDRVDVWQSRVRALTEMQAPLEELRELVEEAEGLPVAMPEVERIQALIESAEAWQRQLEGLMRGRPAIKRMREVLGAGLQLGVDMPQVEELRLEIKKREWEDAARRSLSSRQTHTLAGLTDLLSAAAEVDAEHGALAQGLRQRIEVAESWEARAADLLDRQSDDQAETRRPTVQDLHQLVSEGLALGIKMDRLSQLNSELERAVAWIQQARATLAKAAALESNQLAAGVEVPGGATSAPAEGSDAAGMEVDEASGEGGEAADDGNSLAVSADASRRGTPEPEASALAAVLLAAVEAHAGPSQPAVARATPPLLPPLPPLPGMPKGKKKTRQPKPKQPKGKDSSPLPELSVIESLLEQYKSLLVQANDEVEGLRKLRSVADGWLEEARPVLQQDFVTDDQLGRLEQLIASGSQVGLAMEQVEILKANVEALLWARKVRALLARLPPAALERPKETAEQPEEAGAAAEPEQQQPAAGDQVMPVEAEQEHASSPAAEAEAEQGAQPAAEPEEQQQQEEGQQRQDDAEPTEEELLAEDAAAQELVAALPGRVEAQELQRGVAATCDTLPFDQRLPLSDFMSLLEEGFILPCDEKLWGQLKGLVETAQEFNTRSAHVLTLGRDGASFANTIDANELQQLLLRADRLSIKLERLPILQDFLASFRQWEAGMRALTQDASGAPVKPSFSALIAASATARSWPITSPLRALADEAVSKTVDWQERCRRLLAKRNTAPRLDAALAAVSQSVDGAVDQFERRLDVEKRLVIAGSDPATARNTPAAPGRSEDREELYCLCQRPFDPQMAQSAPMLGCDTCGEWFHGRCVGLTQSQMRSLRRYSCPVCLAIKGNTEPLEACMAKLQRTKRPTREELAALLPELEALPVQPEEGEVLDRVVRKFDRWKTATTRAVEVHEMSRTTEHAGSILQLSQGMLHCLLKSALALEIDASAYANKVLHLLRCNKWREHAEAAIKPPARLTPDGVSKLLAEGQRLGVDTYKDVTGVKLNAEVAKAQQWAQRARAHVEELKAAKEDADKFAAVADAARELLKEGEAIGVRIEGIKEQLQEHSKLHCLCKKPLLEGVAVVTCTYCQERFHHACVGLKVPGSDGDGDEPPEPFRCPLCCMRMSTKYAHFHKLPEASLEALKQAALKLPPAPAAAAAAAAKAAGKAAPRPLGKGTPKAPGMPVSFAGWPALPAMAATMAAAGIRPGMIPALPPGMTPEQLTAALTQMFQAGMAGGAGMPGMAAMVPGVGPGGQVGMFSVPPQLLALLQKQQAAALAQRAAQEHQQKAKQEGERKEGAQQEQGKEPAAAEAAAATAAGGEAGAKKPVKKRRKSGEQEGAAGEPKPKKPRPKKAAEGGEVKPAEEGKSAGEGGDKAEKPKPAPKRRKSDKQAEPGKEAEGKPKKQPSEGGKKKGLAAESGGEAGSPEGAAKLAKKKRPAKPAAAAASGKAEPAQQQQEPLAESGKAEPASGEAAGDKAGGQKRRRSSRHEEPAADPNDAAQSKDGAAAAAAAGGEAKPAAKRKKPADKPQARQEPAQPQQEQGQPQQQAAANEGEQKPQPPEGRQKQKEEGKQADKAESSGKEESGAARRRSGRLQRP